MESLYREIKIPSGGLIYLFVKASSSFLRLVGTVRTYLPSCGLVTSDDINRVCKIELGKQCEKEAPVNDVGAFLASVEAEMRSDIDTHRFYAALDNLSLSGVDQMKIGRVTIQKSGLSILEYCAANKAMVTGTWGRVGRGDICSSNRSQAIRRAAFFEGVKATNFGPVTGVLAF